MYIYLKLLCTNIRFINNMILLFFTVKNTKINNITYLRKLLKLDKNNLPYHVSSYQSKYWAFYIKQLHFIFSSGCLEKAEYLKCNWGLYCITQCLIDRSTPIFRFKWQIIKFDITLGLYIYIRWRKCSGWKLSTFRCVTEIKSRVVCLVVILTTTNVNESFQFEQYFFGLTEINFLLFDVW